jgi:hypothetical protein
VEAAPVDADDNPCVLEKRVVLLKELDVFIARLCHLGERSVEADEQQGGLVLGKRLGGEDGGKIAKRGCGGRREPKRGAMGKGRQCSEATVECGEAAGR